MSDLPPFFPMVEKQNGGCSKLGGDQRLSLTVIHIIEIDNTAINEMSAHINCTG